MYSFCLTIPYAALLALGGVVGFLTKGSTPSLVSGLGSAAIIGGLAYYSLQEYHRGRISRPADFVCLVVSAALAYVMYQRFQRTGKFMPSGIITIISTFMVGFLLWNLTLFKPTFKKSAA